MAGTFQLPEVALADQSLGVGVSECPGVIVIESPGVKELMSEFYEVGISVGGFLDVMGEGVA